MKVSKIQILNRHFKCRFNRVGLIGDKWMTIPINTEFIFSIEGKLCSKTLYFIHKTKLLPKCRKQYKHQKLMK